MANDLAKLVVKLEAQTAQYTQQLERANKKLSKFQKTQKRALNQVRSAFNGLAATLAGGLFIKANADALEFADNIGKLSTRLGASTEFLSEMSFVAEQTGVRFESLTMGLQRMVRRVSEAAQGTGEAVKALQEMNLNAAELAKLSPEQQFSIIADSLQGLESQADRVRLAMKLFDSEGVALVQTMAEGSEGINKLREEASALGLTLSQEATDQAARSRDAINRMQRSVTALTQAMALQLGPTIERVADFMAKNVQPVFGFVGRAIDGVRFIIVKWVQVWVSALRILAEGAAKIESIFGGDTFKNVSLSLQGINDSLQVTADGFFEGAVAVDRFNSALQTLPNAEERTNTSAELLPFDLSRFDKLREQGEKKMDEIRASMVKKNEGVADELASTFVRGFENGFDGVLDGFKNLLAQMAAQYAQSQIVSLITGLLPGGAAAGGAGGLLSKFLPGFASGGQFMVGGRPGRDNNVAAFNVTRGERVTIETPAQQRDAMAGGNSVRFDITGNVDDMTRRQINRMIRDGTLQAALNGGEIQAGAKPVFVGG